MYKNQCYIGQVPFCISICNTNNAPLLESHVIHPLRDSFACSSIFVACFLLKLLYHFSSEFCLCCICIYYVVIFIFVLCR